MLSVKIVPKNTYAEESQTNPLRWYILDKQADGSFVNVSANIKCKDFFNDLAYTLQTGKTFTIYGFNAGSLGLKPENPVWMLLTNTTDAFKNNFEVMNKWLTTQGAPQIPLEDADKGLVITFDPWYFKNTYRISLISLLIRIINCDKAFKNFQEIAAYDVPEYGDKHKWSSVVKRGMYFNVPKKYDKYVWYCGPTVNSVDYNESQYGLAGYVHNNGVLGWSGAIGNS